MNPHLSVLNSHPPKLNLKNHIRITKFIPSLILKYIILFYIISDATKKVTLNLAKFLPVKYDTYFHYSGSLTTPPCYESVKWIVNPTPLRVSESMVRILSLRGRSKITSPQKWRFFDPPPSLFTRANGDKLLPVKIDQV